jgi:hypothetical protein
MSSLLLVMDGWANTASRSGNARKYDNDTGTWTSISSGNVFNQNIANSPDNEVHKGAWDGNRWYVISATGGLHAYTLTTDSWVGPLVSGSAVITGASPNTANWCMTSDGSYVYMLSDRNDFRRYDPSLDAVTALALPPGSGYTRSMFLTYDGSGSIYGSKGGPSSNVIVAKYDIATNAWTALPAGAYAASILGAAFVSWTAMLSGSFWLILNDNGGTLRSYQYNPATNAWVTKATSANDGGFDAAAPGGEDSDSSIKVWSRLAVASRTYDIVANTWSAGANSPTTFNEGTNFTVTRVFSAAFTWYQSDGTTLLVTTVDLGGSTLGDTLTYHAVVKTPVARAAGVTVSVPVNTTTDAEDPVTICATVGGTYGTSFTTGALSINDQFDVFIKIIPTAMQTLGLAKRFFLKLTPVG